MYPDNFQAAVNGPLPSVTSFTFEEMYGINNHQQFDDEAFGLHRKFTFDIVLHYTANILGLLRFELRVLRFFSEVCVPFLTYNVNRRHSIVWEVVVPKYVTSSPAVKQAVLAVGCLNIMPLLGMDRLVETETDAAKVAQVLEARSDSYEVQRLFADDYMLEHDDEINLFRHASQCFTNAVSGTNEAVQQLQDPGLSCQDRNYWVSSATITSYLMYCFLGLHPWRMLPLVHFPAEGECPQPDMLSIASGLKTVIWENVEELRAGDIGELFQMDEFQIVLRLKVRLVKDLEAQLEEYLRNYSFLEIDLSIAAFIEDMKDALYFFNRACSLSVMFNYPVLIYKWLPMVGPQLIPYVRAKEPFALHFLYVYACICVFFKFWSFEHNVWRDFIVWMRENTQLSEFDERMYQYVIVGRNYVEGENYRALEAFDVWSRRFDYSLKVTEEKIIESTFDQINETAAIGGWTTSRGSTNHECCQQNVDI